MRTRSKAELPAASSDHEHANKAATIQLRLSMALPTGVPREPAAGSLRRGLLAPFVSVEPRLSTT